MKFKLACVVFLLIVLPFSLVSASEDVADSSFDENFSFDEIPEITPTKQLNEEKEKNSLVVNTEDNNKIINADINDKKVSSSTPSPLVSKKPLPDISPNNNFNGMKISGDQSFTETLKNNEKYSSSSQNGETWVERIVSTNPLSMLFPEKNENYDANDDGLKKLIRESKLKNKFGKANVEVFDISGIMLNMKLKDVEKAMMKNGFKKLNARFQIPNFIKWRNEEFCRNSGVVGYENLEACVAKTAKEKGYQYPEYVKYVKFDSKEEIEVFLTSNFTDNSVYKILYSSDVPNITGNSPKSVYIRNLKVFDFWRRINTKYGAPDNKTTVTWGSGGDSPFMKASTGIIILEDPKLKQKDYNRMAEEDKKFIASDFYNF